MSGKGLQTFPDGKIYEGQYIDSKFCGQGKVIYNSGKFQEGEFRDGKFYKENHVEEKHSIHLQNKESYIQQRIASQLNNENK